MITAEKVYKEILDMPLAERERLFAAIASRGFEKDIYKHDEVFDDSRQSPFALKEAAVYLESVIICFDTNNETRLIGCKIRVNRMCLY